MHGVDWIGWLGIAVALLAAEMAVMDGILAALALGCIVAALLSAAALPLSVCALAAIGSAALGLGLRYLSNRLATGQAQPARSLSAQPHRRKV